MLLLECTQESYEHLRENNIKKMDFRLLKLIIISGTERRI